MENQEKKGGLPSNIPLKYSPEDVEGKLTSTELEELNALVDRFAIDEDFEATIDHDRWLELDNKAQGR